MVVFHNDIVNAIARARNIRHLLAANILERWQQGEEATSEQTESLIQLGDWIGFLTDAEQLVVEDCIDSDDVWNIIQQINEQAVGLDCTGTDLSYLNLPPAPIPNVYNYVESVTGLNTNNADPQHPVVRISVDGVTVTGQGTPASPLVSPPSGVQSVTDDGNGVVSVDNTDSVNPIVKFNGVNVDGVTITGDGTTGNPLTGATQLSLETNATPNPTQNLLNLVEGNNITITDDGSGNITFNVVGGGSTPDLQQVTTVSATTTNTIIVGNPSANSSSISPTVVGSGDAVVGTSAYLNKDGFLGLVNSNGDYAYLKNDSATSGNVTLEFPNKTTGSYTIATTADITSGVTSVGATAPITSTGGATPTISTSINTNKLIGRSSAGIGVMEEITVGSGLNLSAAGTLTATGGGGVSSVGLSMPTAFNVANSPVTGSATLTVTGAGTTAQYIRGDGSLGIFPSIGGGGGGTVYYLNGNTSQGSIGGTTMYQLSKSAGTGTAANFTRSTTGTIASFITDIGDPNQLTIPAGIWVFECYFSESGGGANHAQIQAIVEKWDGTSITLLGTGVIEEITNGNTKDLYQMGVTIPSGTTLSLSDRIVIQIQISNANGKTVTLYTEDSNLSSVTTTFANGIASLNGLTATSQTFQNGTIGSSPAFNSAGSVHTLNIPLASASGVTQGLISNTQYNTFNGKQDAITGAATTITTSNLTASRALASDGSGKVAVSSVTSTELSYLSGVTSAIQTQLNGKESTITTLPISKGGTNSGTALNNNRVIQSSGGAIVEAAAITASRALISDANGIPTHSSVTSTELGYVSGVTGAIQTQIDTKTNKLITTSRQTASYILALSDADKLVEMNVATANTLTVPLNSTVAFPVGTQILIAQYGAGQTTVTAAGGVTIRSNGGKTKLNVQYSGATLIKIDTNEWYLFGDITV